MKNCAVFNDISGFGKCSLTAVIPVLSAMKVQVNPIPTAVLTSQTAFDSFYMQDLGDTIPNFVKEWQKMNVSFNGILTGFMGSDKQIEYIEEFIKTFKSDNTLLVVDPVMADDGEMYVSYTDSMCKKVCKLCTMADVITPNATELSIICDKPFTNDLEQLGVYAKSLITDTLKTVIVTGIINDDKIYTLCVTKEDSTPFSVKRINKSFGGTGDIFSSVITGCLLNGFTPQKSVEIAQDFVALSIKSTMNKDPRYGVDFENHLEDLICKIKKYSK